jgi:protein-serine/threonine kinase
MTLMLPSGPYNGSSGALTSGQSSPTLNFTEDLTRFPSESLHSFSFTQQSEEFIHSRQNVLKRSIEFMKDKLGWTAASASIASAQARATGDHEMQSMLELVARAKRVESGATGGLMIDLNAGPLTGPPIVENENLFDRSFLPCSESPENYGSTTTSPFMIKKTMDLPGARSESSVDRKPVVSTEEVSPCGEMSSEPSSRTPTNESGTTQKTSPPSTRRQSLKRTYTDTSPLALQNKLMEIMAQPYIAGESFNDHLSPIIPNFSASSSFGVSGPHPIVPAVHGYASRWAPAAQAIFTTESKAPWTILAANDLACLVFGVTKAEVRKMGILEVVQEERRAWLEEKLGQPGSEADHKARTSPQSQSIQDSLTSTSQFLLAKGGLTASLLSKPPSRSSTPLTPNRRSQTVDSGSSTKRRTAKAGLNHNTHKSRGVLLCGDVVPIQKRNGHTGSASLWVKEKRGGLIWVLEEIHEDVAIISVDDDGRITKITGSLEPIWGESFTQIGMDIGSLLPRIPRQGSDPRIGELDYVEIAKWKYFTVRNSSRINIPAAVEKVTGSTELRVSSFPHIAGIMVLNSKTLEITSSNSVFSAALFGQDHPDGLPITDLIPDFDRILRILTDEDGVQLVDGIVIPEHSFRRARAFLALREGKADAASYFLRPDGLLAKHRDGSSIKIDAQMRVVKSDKQTPVYDEHVITEEDASGYNTAQFEVVYALWITYSRHLHSSRHNLSVSPMLSRPETPLRQPSPGQNEVVSPAPVDTDSDEPEKEAFHPSLLTRQLREAASKSAAKSTSDEISVSKEPEKEKPALEVVDPTKKKSIEDFVILEEMGQGAYGQVKLARYRKTGAKVVLKYVTKRRILVDTWTRDRRLGTVPLEIHVLDYLRRDGLKHPNIVEMADFFEDSVNYYIEMVPHGLPGMDLFDYIELRVNMQAAECRSIFVQVARAIHHLHTKALVVHRDIKDENVVLDGDGNIKLIDFGSAAYIKNGPFDVFVGTIGKCFPFLSKKPKNDH